MLLFYWRAVIKNAWFWWENQRERGNLGDPGVDGKIKINVQELGGVGMDWMELA